ncbi:MAG TPA: cupredoxin domain-containing protein [Chloroflexota bacterium]|nr:cupredoxin domain-containing protein [Chloroflexota bacterium]
MIRSLVLAARFALAGAVVATLTVFSALADDDTDGAAGATQADAPAQLVVVTASDFKFDPADITVGNGAVSFSVTNRGIIDHNFAVETPGGDILGSVANFAPRSTATLDLTLAPGAYSIVCTLPAHREAGMIGTLTVNP